MLRLKCQTAIGLLMDEKRKGSSIAVVEGKKFEPKNNLEKLEDYGGSPEESFWQRLENAPMRQFNLLIENHLNIVKPFGG